MAPKEITQMGFLTLLSNAVRIWDHKNEKGMSLNRIDESSLSIEEIKYVLTRDDNWSIACSEDGYESCYELWRDEWKSIYRAPNYRSKFEEYLGKEEVSKLKKQAKSITFYGYPLDEISKEDIKIALAFYVRDHRYINLMSNKND